MTTEATPTTMTKQQLDEHIKSVAREAGIEAIGDQIREEVEKGFREWEKKSESQKHKDHIKRFRAQLFSGGQPSPIKGLGSTRFSHIEGAEEMTFDGQKAALVGLLMAKSGFDRDKAIGLAKENGHHSVAKALEASDFSAGGSLIPEQYAVDFIGFLYNRSAVRRMGARIIELPDGKINIGRQNATATHYWVGESDEITVSNPGTGALVLSAKKGGVIVPVSNDLLRRGGAGVSAMIRDDMTNVTAVGEDAAFIRGNGGEHSPKGILNAVASGQKFNANGTFNIANAAADGLKAIYKVDSAKIPMMSPGWMMSPRTPLALMSLYTTEGYPAFADMVARGEWLMFPFAKTDNIPTNLGSGDKSEIYFGDFSQFVIGETLKVEIDESKEAAYVDSNGNTISSFTRDMTLVRLVHEVDCVLRHNTAFSVIEAVGWGASFDS